MKNWRQRSCIAALTIGLLAGGAGVLSADDSGWQKMKGQDFIIYYRPDIPDDYVQTTMDTAEDELKRVTDNLGITHVLDWTMRDRIRIYIYSDQDDYVKYGGQATWSHGVAFAQARTIKTFPAANGFFDSVLPHELGHIVFRDYIGFSTEVPLWFEEGVAIYQEKAKRLGSAKTVKEAIENGQFIALTGLTGMRLYKTTDDKEVNLFYAEAASAVYYMITELGEQEFYFLCGELKKNTPFEEALHKVYLRFKTVNDLNKAWVDYLQG